VEEKANKMLNLKPAEIKTLLFGLTIGIVAPLVVEAIKKNIRKAEKSSQPNVEANTDHSFVAWTGDDNFFEIEGVRNVATNPHMRLAPLSSKESFKQYPVFKKYSKFSVSPAKKIKIKS
jgi:hypothetical protein